MTKARSVHDSVATIVALRGLPTSNDISPKKCARPEQAHDIDNDGGTDVVGERYRGDA